jgi:hypothetical protein
MNRYSQSNLTVIMAWGVALLLTVGAVAQDLDPDDAIMESRPLLPQGAFDAPRETPENGSPAPLGWKIESGDGGTCVLDAEHSLGGGSALKVQPGPGPLTLVSDQVPVGDGLRTITALAMGLGHGAAHVTLRWGGPEGVLREDPLRKIPGEGGAWTRFTLDEIEVPPEARWLALALVTETPDGTPAWWDEAQITGNYQRTPSARVFVNQAGYEILAPKKFTAAANFVPQSARFSVLNAAGDPIYTGTLDNAKRIVGNFDSDWGEWYFRGDFTPCDLAGPCRIRVHLDDLESDSPEFEIGQDLLWQRTAGLALRAFLHQRCGTDVPGYHGPCHLDDAVEGHDLHGGWHDGSAYDKRDNALCLWTLTTAFSAAKWRIDKSPELSAAFQDEMQWGAEYVARSLREDGGAYGAVVSNPEYWGAPEKETDLQPGSGDERFVDASAGEDPSLHAGALARGARWASEDKRAILSAPATRGLDWALNHGHRGPYLFSAAMDLDQATREPRFADLARELFPGPEPACMDSVVDFETRFEIVTTTILALALINRANELLKQADNPFGVYTAGFPSAPNFFDAPATGKTKPVGNSARVLQAAAQVAQAYRFTPSVEYRTFIYDQLNWILGNNPCGVCLMEGAGRVHAPTYYHRYAAGGVARGAVPGAIAHGITSSGPGADRPRFDASGAERPDPASNGISLRTVALYLDTLCPLKRLRFAGDDKTE